MSGFGAEAPRQRQPIAYRLDPDAAVSDLICDVDFVSRADYVPDVDPRLQLGAGSPREKAAIFCNSIGSTDMHGITDVPAALLKQLHAIITLYSALSSQCVSTGAAT